MPARIKQLLDILPEHDPTGCIKEPLMHPISKTQTELGSGFLNIKTDKHRVTFAKFATITGSPAGINAIPAMAAGSH